jgi:polysaccharide biosynthesis protein PslJ
MAFALVLVDILRTPEQIRRLTTIIMLAGTAAALVGIILWLMPDQLAENSLSRLSIIGYPNGGVIQYIEANPELSERAIGTSVNPNSLGGLLVMVAALAAPQLLTHYPVVGKRWVVVLMLILLMGCLVLTFSRGSMLAFAAALFFIALLRYRRVLGVLVILGLILLILPWSQPYIERFAAGFQGADLATQMRFGEYSDAITLVSRYPLLGVGFSGAPDIDIYLGVSSVYLLLAENMGLLGLATFLLLMVSLFAYAFLAYRKLDAVPGLRPVWLGLLAGLIGALINGVVDHYFFNLEFHHAILIFWIFVGMTLATTRVILAIQQEESRRTG